MRLPWVQTGAASRWTLAIRAAGNRAWQSCLQAAFQAAAQLWPFTARSGAGNRACSRLSGGSQTLSTGDRSVSLA